MRKSRKSGRRQPPAWEVYRLKSSPAEEKTRHPAERPRGQHNQPTSLLPARDGPDRSGRGLAENIVFGAPNSAAGEASRRFLWIGEIEPQWLFRANCVGGLELAFSMPSTFSSLSRSIGNPPNSAEADAQSRHELRSADASCLIASPQLPQSQPLYMAAARSFFARCR